MHLFQIIYYINNSVKEKEYVFAYLKKTAFELAQKRVLNDEHFDFTEIDKIEINILCMKEDILEEKTK